MSCDKRGYGKNEVLRVREAVYKRRPAKLRVYECPDCGMWHLTSSFKTDYIKIRNK